MRAYQVLDRVPKPAWLGWPERPPWALLSWMEQRARLRRRGFAFQPRGTIDPGLSEQIDACWSAHGISLIDPIRGADLQTRSLILSLEAGEPFRITRALASEAAHLATSGAGQWPRVEWLLRRAVEQAPSITNEDEAEYVRNYISLAKATSAYLVGRWKEARDHCDRAETYFTERRTKVAWERAAMHAFSLWSHMYMGEVRTISAQLTQLIDDARDRHDIFTLATLGTQIRTFVRIAEDRPELARRELDEVAERARRALSKDGLHVQDHDSNISRLLIALYEGKAEAAWDLMSEQAPKYRRSLLLYIQLVRIEFTSMRAFSALAKAAAGDDRRSLLHTARKQARLLRRERVGWAEALGRLIEASETSLRGDLTGALARLQDAETRLFGLDMGLYAAAARRRRGELLGDAGRELVREADDWMIQHGIERPDRMAAVYAPGFTRPGG